MGSFVFSNYDVIFISVSINACFLLQMIMTRVVAWLVPFLSRRSSMGRNLLSVHQKWPDLLGRILMEQISLLLILILILINLGFVSSSILPFHEHNDSEYHQLTRVVLSASTARFFVIAVSVALVTNVPFFNAEADQSHFNIRGNSGHTKSAGWHFLYCIFSIASNLVGLGYKQNLLLLGTSSFMELNTTSLVICRLIKLADRHRGCQSYLKMSILCCAVCLFSRVLLPGLFLCLALSQETPFVMDRFPMAWFFVSAVVYGMYHVILIYHSIKRINKASAFSSEAATHTCHHRCSDNGPFSIYSYSDRLTNDIYGEALLDSEKQGLDENCLSKPTTKLKDLNYGFLPCYDNRNLCSSVFESEDEKINFLQKKNSSKNEFIYKFITKGNVVKNSEKSSNNVNYSRGVEAVSLVKECRLSDQTLSTDESLYETNQNQTFTNDDKLCSHTNNHSSGMTQKISVDRDKSMEMNMYDHGYFNNENRNIASEEDKDAIVFDITKTSEVGANRSLSRSQSLPTSNSRVWSSLGEKVSDTEIHEMSNSRTQIRRTPNGYFYSNPNILSFKNSLSEKNNHSQKQNSELFVSDDTGQENLHTSP